MPQAPKYRSKPHAAIESSAGPSRPKARPLEQRDPSGIPGVSKLKASIRQTKRLLAKDNLEPGLRIQTQRRLTSLEADLAKAEKRGVEKKNGGKYHMVKFFERQKVLRIIKRLKRSLSDEFTAESQRAALEQDLSDARTMLNYVLHYPNEKKYISLFPSSTSSTPNDTLTLPALLRADTKPVEKSEKARLEILLQIRSMMDSKQLSDRPEEGESDRKRVDVLASLGEQEQASKGKKSAKNRAGAGAGVEDEKDDFFEAE